MTDRPPLDPQKKRRNVAIALALIAFVVLVFVTTLSRLSENRRAASEPRAADVPAAVR